MAWIVMNFQRWTCILDRSIDCGRHVFNGLAGSHIWTYATLLSRCHLQFNDKCSQRYTIYTESTVSYFHIPFQLKWLEHMNSIVKYSPECAHFRL